MKRYPNGGTDDQIITHGVPVAEAIPISLIAMFPTFSGEKLVVTYNPEGDDATVLHLGRESVGLTHDQTRDLANLLLDLLEGDIT
jgi:hypothetical protein